MTTLEDFEKAYAYSDDGRYYRAGAASEKAIREAAKKFPRDDVERIWNAQVDRKLVASARATFYWRD